MTNEITVFWEEHTKKEKRKSKTTFALTGVAVGDVSGYPAATFVVDFDVTQTPTVFVVVARYRQSDTENSSEGLSRVEGVTATLDDANKLIDLIEKDSKYQGWGVSLESVSATPMSLGLMRKY